MSDFQAARRNMVDCQLRTNEVTEPRLIAAMEELPREMFVPKARQGSASVDEDLPIGGGRWLMEPLVLARLVQALEISPGETALVLGCGSGYDAALLGRLAASVVAVETDAELVEQATASLSRLDCDNVAVIEGALAAGYSSQAPYDVIFVSGAVAAVPETLFAQLAPHGRLGAVIRGVEAEPGRATVYMRTGGGVSGRPVFDCGTPWLTGFEPQPAFVF
ncbi:MAG: protein-L-isoaspartate O-methyltransferase [Alphaproteobacteria bacterium]